MVGIAPGLLHERIVVGHAAVIVDAVQLAVRTAEILRELLVAAVADRVEQVSVLVEDEARAEVRVVDPIEFRRRLEQRLMIGQPEAR